MSHLFATVAEFNHIVAGQLQGFTGILHAEQNIFGVACSPATLCCIQRKVQSILADHTDWSHGHFHTRTAVMTVEDYKIWYYLISSDKIFPRKPCQHPDLSAALQGTGSFISDTFTQQVIGELKCFFVLHMR